MLKLPLDNHLCDVLNLCNMALCQLSSNGIRVVLGHSTLNKLLGVNLTWNEIFWCYAPCRCPKDSSWYYFRARIGALDLVKGLTKSEKWYYEGMMIIGNSWDDRNIVKIKKLMSNKVGRFLGCV